MYYSDVRADVRAHLDRLAAQPRPPLNAEVLAQIRQVPPEVMAQMLTALDVPTGEVARREDLTMPGPGGDIALRLYDARAERREAGPAVVFYHGGGFVVGGIATHDSIAAEIARSLDLPVVSVEYRLAPENPWPAAPDDAEAAARWVAENGTALGLSVDGLIVCGDSAGGNLAAVTAIALREKAAAAPVVFQLLILSGTDRGSTRGSRQDFADGYGLDGSDMALSSSIMRRTTARGAARRSPPISPACRPRCSSPPRSIRSATTVAPMPPSWSRRV